LHTAKKMGVTQAMLAKAAGISQSSVHNWGHGSIPSSDHIMDIAKLLGVSVEWILTGLGKPFSYVGSNAAKALEDKINRITINLDTLEGHLKGAMLMIQLLREQLSDDTGLSEESAKAMKGNRIFRRGAGGLEQLNTETNTWEEVQCE